MFLRLLGLPNGVLVGELRCSFILILSRTPCRCCLRTTRKGQDDKRLARWEVTEHVRGPRMLGKRLEPCGFGPFRCGFAAVQARAPLRLHRLELRALWERARKEVVTILLASRVFWFVGQIVWLSGEARWEPPRAPGTRLSTVLEGK